MKEFLDDKKLEVEASWEKLVTGEQGRCVSLGNPRPFPVCHKVHSLFNRLL